MQRRGETFPLKTKIRVRRLRCRSRMPRSGRLPRTAGRLSLELDLGAQVFGIAPDRRDGEGPAGAAIGHPAVLGLDLPVDLDLAPQIGRASGGERVCQ